MPPAPIPPDDLLRNLSKNSEQGLVDLVNRLDQWLATVDYNDLSEAREIYGRVMCTFAEENEISNIRNTRDQFSHTSGWWDTFYKDVIAEKARYIFRLSGGHTPPPNLDLPSEIKNDYEEARSILLLSSRGAAALLRLAVQKICRELGRPGKSLNDDIEALFQNGLPPVVVNALHAVRVIGNNAVHPGQIDVAEEVERVSALFMVVNFISEKAFSEPKRIKEIYDVLPESARAAIEESRKGQKRS